MHNGRRLSCAPGIPFRRAHELVGKECGFGVEQSCELEQLSKEDYALCASMQRAFL